jgi:histidinol-phosphatase (PHP family)
MQNLHTHTTYVDGKLTPEEMILAAIERGCDSLGFSEHSFVTFDEYYSMTPEMTYKYIDEIRALKEKYKDQIEIFTGLEIDYYTAWRPESGLDYILATAHYVQVTEDNGDKNYVSVDAGPDRQKEIVEKYYNGDFYAMAEDYFSIMSKLPQATKPDIIGHFDLVAKYNINNNIFDEQHPRYIKASLDSMDAILEHCNIFEVNTGAMYRLNKPEPYPSAFLLKELYKRGGEVIMCSDSHDGKSICYAYDEVAELLKSCGFKHQKRLTKDGFINLPL